MCWRTWSRDGNSWSGRRRRISAIAAAAAWIDGEVRRNVDIDLCRRPDHVRSRADSPRRHAGAAASSGFPVWLSRVSPMRTRTSSTAACVAEPMTEAALSGPGATGCTTSPVGSTRTRLRELAFAGYLEMLCAGYTAVGEFHYLHHPPGGGRYDDPNAMGLALAAAADESGIGLDPARYRLPCRWLRRAGFCCPATLLGWLGDGLGRAGQSVASGSAGGRRDSLGPRGAGLATCRRWSHAAGTDRVLHVHLSEQPAENADALAATGRTPTQLLADAGAIGAAHRRRARHPPHRPGYPDPRRGTRVSW